MNTLLKILLGPMGTMIEDGGEGGSKPERKPAQPKAPKGTAASRLIISLLITVLFASVYYYIELPALNIYNGGFYWFILLICLVFSACMIFLRGFRADTPKEYLVYSKKSSQFPSG